MSLLAFALGLLLTAAPIAGAATIERPTAEVFPGEPSSAQPLIVYTAGVGESNNLSVAYNATTARYEFTDAMNVIITLGAGAGDCTLGPALYQASCADPQVPTEWPFGPPAADDTCDPNSQDGLCPEDHELKLSLGDLNDIPTVVVKDVNTDVHFEGGPGDDTLTGAAGRNVMLGGPGSDELIGGPNGDRLYAVEPTTFANGGGGDTLRPGLGSDFMSGGSGDDLFDMGAEPDESDQIASGGNDVLGRNGGEDTISYAARGPDDPISFNMDNESVQNGGRGGASDPTLGEFDSIGTPDVENLVGSQGDDLLIGGDAANTLSGGPGSDVICGGLGLEDTVDYSDQTAPVAVTLGAPNDVPANVRIRPRAPASGTPYGIENLGGQVQVNTFGPHGFAAGQQVHIERSHPDVNGTTTIATVVDEDSFTLAVAFTGLSGDGAISPGDVPAVRSVECATGVDQGGEEDAQDCLFDDGVVDVATGVSIERDCVSASTENVIGGNGDDTLIGADPLLHRNEEDPSVVNKKSQISGANVLSGCGGSDLLIGLDGADTFEGDIPTLASPDTEGRCIINAGGIEDIDEVSYEERIDLVRVSLNGVRDDGNADDSDVNEPSELRRTFDSISDDIESVIGGSGNDFIEGSAGDDHSLAGGPGNDAVHGLGGDDGLHGGPGIDALEGGAGSDGLSGDGDGDTLDGGPGPDTLSGGDGTDLADYSVALTPVFVSANGAPDDGVAGEGDNVGGDVESVTGGIDNDVLATGPGDGVLNGGAGNDMLDGGAGADTLLGGEGIDTASYAARGAPVAVTLGVPGGDGESGENDNVNSDVENVVGGAANDNLSGDGGANLLNGGGGDDALSGGAGFDNLLGGSGADDLAGGDDGDFVSGGDGTDTLKGDGGNDTMNGGGGDDTHDGGPGADSMSAGGGKDTVSYATRSNDVDVTLDGNANDGEANENDLVRTDVASVTTGSGDDTVDARDGLAGDVSCGAGTDAVQGDTDDDVATNCEQVNRVGTFSRCRVASSPLSMSGGTVSVRVTCPMRVAGTLTLQTAAKVRASARARILTLGRKRFSTTAAGQTKRVTVKLTRKAKRALRRRSRIRVRAIVKARTRGVSKPRRVRGSRTLTLRVKKG